MLRALRVSLMWLIALAVPLQGYAAAAMFACGPGHHGGTGVSQVAPPHGHEMHADDHPEAAAAEWSDTDHHGGGASPDRSEPPEAQGAGHKVSKTKCAPCASCCVVAALPAAVMRFEPVPLVDSFVPLAQIGASSFLADGLERPPRLPLV